MQIILIIFVHVGCAYHSRYQRGLNRSALDSFEKITARLRKILANFKNLQRSTPTIFFVTHYSQRENSSRRTSFENFKNRLLCRRYHGLSLDLLFHCLPGGLAMSLQKSGYPIAKVLKINIICILKIGPFFTRETRNSG